MVSAALSPSRAPVAGIEHLSQAEAVAALNDRSAVLMDSESIPNGTLFRLRAIRVHDQGEW